MRGETNPGSISFSSAKLDRRHSSLLQAYGNVAATSSTSCVGPSIARARQGPAPTQSTCARLGSLDLRTASDRHSERQRRHDGRIDDLFARSASRRSSPPRQIVRCPIRPTRRTTRPVAKVRRQLVQRMHNQLAAAGAVVRRGDRLLFTHRSPDPRSKSTARARTVAERRDRVAHPVEQPSQQEVRLQSSPSRWGSTLLAREVFRR